MRPLLSVVVVVHRMPRQASRTLQSLIPPYQRGIDRADVEIVVVENESDRSWGEQAALTAGADVYYSRREVGSSPAAACNQGLAVARGDLVALMVDGARMVTPGVMAAALMASRIGPSTLISVPGYHLGERLQRDPAVTGYDEEAEEQLLASVVWPDDGYRLFDIAVMGGSMSRGFFLPYAESTFLAASRQMWALIGGMDEDFASPGGGFVNLDLYRRACELPGAQLVVLPGEGTFHQFHGGVTTGKPGLDRDRLMHHLEDEYAEIRGRPFLPPDNAPIQFGRLHPAAARFVQFSAEQLGQA